MTTRTARYTSLLRHAPLPMLRRSASSLGTGMTNNTSNTQRGVQAGSAAVPMVAVLTTRRVLMLSAARLTPLAEAWGHPPNSRAALNTSGGLSVAVVSISWAGSSVLCALEDGRCDTVDYICALGYPTVVGFWHTRIFKKISAVAATGMKFSTETSLVPLVPMHSY